ncbi:MAG TPA: methyltransferase domain-containing protein [Thermoanaerobaculia bacterium]|jgi:ubiquinone/menaquinone biosynthesis C-methylase UbiE|nr:methyltransferase domain-containing protein [Thermoanaerobaculia bacterium]HPA51408.1 methyltransferase domain-containing protein [Thermoanaerobaculia bacterium]
MKLPAKLRRLASAARLARLRRRFLGAGSAVDHWDELARAGEAGAGRQWTELAQVQEVINERISGEAHVNPYLHFMRRHLAGRLPVARALTIGCGTGELERGLFRHGFAIEHDGFDIAPEAVRGAIAAAKAEGCRGIRYSVADANALLLEPDSYDVVFGVHSIHHVERLENAFEQIALALKPDGLLFLNEFVGPSRFQWSRRQLEVIDGVLRLLPERFLRSRVRGTIKKRAPRPSVRRMLATDPSEAVRSDEILALVDGWFDVVEVRPYGGTVLHPLLDEIAGNFARSEDGGSEILAAICRLEWALIQAGDLTSDFAVVVARKRGGVQAGARPGGRTQAASPRLPDRYEVAEMNPMNVFRRLSGKPGKQADGTQESYKEWWTASSASESGAYSTTYVADGEADYRSRGWNGDANSFGARQLIEIAGLTPSSRVLEVGCGMARVGREMAPKVAEWHGADISANMLEFARARTSHLTNVHLHELSDVSLSAFADASFDFVYITTVLMHLDKEDVYRYLLESHRVLKPGAMAFFDTWNLLHPDTHRIWRAIQADNVGSSKLRGRIQFSTAPELRRNLEEVGFEVVRLDEDRLLRAFARKREAYAYDPSDTLPPFGYVDEPRNESTVSGSLEVGGWVLDGIESVEIRLDGVRSLGRARLGLPRADVAELFPRYRDAAACGFGASVPTEGLPPGSHTLQVIARDRDGFETDLCGNYRSVTFAS